MSAYVEKDFYVQPPPKGASHEEWMAWWHQDQAQEECHACAEDLEEIEESQMFEDAGMKRHEGVWRASTPIVANEEPDLDAIVDAMMHDDEPQQIEQRSVFYARRSRTWWKRLLREVKKAVVFMEKNAAFFERLGPCVFRRCRSLIPAASRTAIPAIAITPRV
jgi:hypothetical protein